MINNPLVSILIPNFNKAPYLRETLNCILEQTYTEWECIIVDDHSTDNSWEILQEYAGLDPRFKVFKRPIERKKGGNAARNFAFENSKGVYIQWLDSDDVIQKNKIAQDVSKLVSLNDKVISVSNWSWFSNSINELQNDIEYLTSLSTINQRWKAFPKDGLNLLLHLFKQNSFIPIHSYFYSKALLRESGLWNENLTQNQDGEFMLRVLLKSKQVVFNDSILAFYRRPDSNHLSKQATLSSYQDWYRSLFLGDQNILEVQDSKEIRSILIMNYERLIKFTGLEFPQVTQIALERMNVLNPKVKYDLSKPYLIWLGSWLGFKNFIRIRDILVGLKIMKQ